MNEPWKGIASAVGSAAMQRLAEMSPAERERILARVQAGDPPPKRYEHGWAEGREFQMHLIVMHLHARGFCEAAKAIEAPGFFGSFGMTGGDGFSQEAFERTHVCKEG